VLPDNVGGARAAARYLAELGHREIGIIDGPALLTSTHDRLSSFVSQLLELGIALPPDRIAPGDFSRDGGVRAAHWLLDRHPQLTALFALNDVMAIGVLSALRERGIAVPAQVSVVGFDDIPIACDVTPALTTVQVPMADLGAHAVQLALGADNGLLHVEHLPTQLVERASSAPPPPER
jgi:LacI family transcriptional regulator